MLLALLIGVIAAGDDSLTRLAEMPRRPGGAVVSALIVGGSGLDASETFTRDATGDHRGGAFTIRSVTRAYSFDRGVIVRLVNEIEIGGGASDRGAMFQGELLGSLMGGYRISVTENQGPFVRAGILGLVAGNDLAYRSALVLPDAHVGWQYLLSRKVLAEAAFTSGLILTGRSDAVDLDIAVAMGTTVAIHTNPISFTSRWMHLIPTNSSAHVDWFEGALCAEPGRSLSICMRARWDHEDTLQIYQVGLTLGTQQKKRLHSAGLY